MPDYQTFFNISHDYFCVLDGRGYYQRVNPALFKLLGYSETELTSLPFTDFIHPDDIAITENEYRHVTEGNRNRVIENRFRSRNGAYHWISWSTIVGDGAGKFYSSGQNITQQKLASEKHKRTLEENKRKITKAIIQTQESERSRISQELHDNVNQVLTTVKLLVEISKTRPENAREMLERAEALQQEAINDIRSLSKRLSAPSLGNLRLTDSLRELVTTYPRAANPSISIAFSDVDSTWVDQYVHLALYRVLQEGLTNIIKHADATRVEVKLERVDGKLLLEVKDDGKGFDLRKKSDGVGIQNIQARVESIHGTFSLVSEPGAGTVLGVTVPVTD